jgi:hypothetical protein
MPRLTKLSKFYDDLGVYPNYICLIPEPASHLFKNIQRKQRLLDEKNQNVAISDKESNNADISKKLQCDPKIFDSGFLNSVMLRHNNISHDNKSFENSEMNPSISLYASNAKGLQRAKLPFENVI